MALDKENIQVRGNGQEKEKLLKFISTMRR